MAADPIRAAARRTGHHGSSSAARRRRRASASGRWKCLPRFQIWVGRVQIWVDVASTRRFPPLNSQRGLRRRRGRRPGRRLKLLEKALELLWRATRHGAQYGNDALVAIVQIWVDSTAWLAETWSHVEAETHIWKVRVHERLSLLQPAPAAAKPLRALHASAQYGATAKPLRALPSPDPDNLLERERRKWAEASHGMRVLSTAPPPDRNNLLERERRRWAAVALKAQGGLRLDLEGLNAFEAMTATMKELGCESGED